ncbi:hypothetical protein D3C87_1068860 [compost metagenome]
MIKKKYLVEDTKKNIFSKNKYWAIVLVAQFLLFYILSKLDFAIQFFSNLFEWKKRLHIFIFSKFGFSIGDVIYTLVILFLLYSIFIILKKRKSTDLRHIFLLLNISYFIYQCFWGMLYFQKPIIEKFQKKEITDQDLKTLAIKYLNLCKATREKVTEDRNGIFLINDINSIKQEIITQQAQLPLQITPKAPIQTLSVKQSLYNKIMNYTGILGYYNPFTAEAQFNPNLPSTQLPFTLAHEMSHQLGYAREQEASFIAFLCAKDSQNLDLRYSAQLYVLKSLLRNLAVKNPAFVKQVLSQYSEKMKRDRLNDLNFYKRYDGLLSDVFGITNDLFLKSNQQEGRITYSYFINLLIAYEA